MTKNRTVRDCYKCGLTVAAGAGLVERFAGRWQIQHKDEAACDSTAAECIDEENERLKREVAQHGCVL